MAVCLDRTVDVPIAFAAIWKTGAAYVPLDPSHPQSGFSISSKMPEFPARSLRRNAHLVEEPGVSLVLLRRIAAGERTIRRSTSGRCTAGRSGLCDLHLWLNRAAKGGGGGSSQRGQLSRCDAARAGSGFIRRRPRSDRTWSFDIAGLELWLPLSIGAHVAHRWQADVMDGKRLAAMIDAHRISVLQATPAIWRLLLESGWSGNRN